MAAGLGFEQLRHAKPSFALCEAGADAVFDKSTELDAFLDYVRIIESRAA